MLVGSGLGALALVAFLVFAVAGLIWLVVTLQQADPAVTRRTTATVALVAGAVLVAVLLAQALFFPRPDPRRALARAFGGNVPGMMRQPFAGPGQMRPPFAGPGRFAPQQPAGPGAPQVRPFRTFAPAQPAPTARPSATP